MKQQRFGPVLTIAFLVAMVGWLMPGPAAYAQAPSAETVIDVVRSAGQPEAVIQEYLASHTLAALHQGAYYDVTFLITNTGLLTVEFFEGQAVSFRLITRRACATPEDLPRMLGLDPSRLVLTDERDVRKAWRGSIDGVALKEVAAVVGPKGWHMAEVQLAGYPERR